MEIDRAVNKTLRDLVQFKLVEKNNEGYVRSHLKTLAIAIWDERGRAFSNNKRRVIVQYDKEGKLLNEFISTKDAARKIDSDDVTIWRALKSGKPTRRGHVWKYKEDIPCK